MFDRVYKLKEMILEEPETLCLERGRIYTATYRENESQPYIIRRAMALSNFLDKMTIFIQEGEYVVGNFASKVGATVLFPEYTFQDMKARYTDFENENFLDEDVNSIEADSDLKEIITYWKGRSVCDRADTAIPDFVQKSKEHGTGGNPYGWNEGQGHISVDYELIINKGFRYVIEEAKCRLDEVVASDPMAYEFLKSIIITSEAAIRFAHRFAKEAQKCANSEKDLERKRELEEIAQACMLVPENPAHTFFEACQSFWFVHLIMHFEQNGFSISPGRFDQYMYPYYKKDIEEGRLTKEKALLILELLWVKFMEITTGGVKISLTPTITLCGKAPDGRDLTNELSYLCIEASAETQMVQPQLTIRWHEKIDQGIMTAVLLSIKRGAAPPAVISDDAFIPGLIKLGIKEEDAYQYTQLGCNETGIAGKLIGGGIPRGISLVKSVELALDGGKSRYTGENIGINTKKLGEYESFEEFLEAYEAQVKHFSRFVAVGINYMDHIQREMVPLPFASSVMNGTIKRGRDIMYETDYFFLAEGCTDFISGLNSIYAIKKVIFEDKAISQEELRKALEANFEGYEDIRLKLWNAAKFGNDDDEVDSMIPQLEGISREGIAPYRSIRKNTGFIFESIPRIAHVSEGLRTKATPDGRKAGDSLPAGISAQLGTDTQGPTALLNSIGKINPDHWVGGVISNIRLHPNLIKDTEAINKVVMLLNAYFKKGGQHIQLNCVSKEILLDAQKNPKNYRDLIVRVSGYCDYFTNLNYKSQEDIIGRTEWE